MCISALMAPGMSSQEHLPGLSCDCLTTRAVSLSRTLKTDQSTSSSSTEPTSTPTLSNPLSRSPPSPFLHTQPRPRDHQPRLLLDETNQLNSLPHLPRALPSSLTSAPIEFNAAACTEVHPARNPSPALPSLPSSEASPDP